MDELKIHKVLLGHYEYPVYADLKALKRNVEAAIPTFLEILDKAVSYNLICRGTSGITIAQWLASNLADHSIETHIRYIKKQGESNHGHGLSISDLILPCVVVDDFISSGTTMRAMAEQCPTNLVEVIFAYNAEKDQMLLTSLFPKVKHLVC